MNDKAKPTAIERVSLDGAAEKLRDQIRSAFAELIPPEQWLEMIKKELERFTAPTRFENPLRRYEGDRVPAFIEKPSILTQMCEEAFREMVKAEVKKALDVWAAKGWDGNNRRMPSDLVQEYFDRNTEAITKAAVSALLLDGMQNIIGQLRSGIG